MKRTSTWRIVATAIPTALVAIGAGYGLGGASLGQASPARVYHTQNAASTTLPVSVAGLVIEQSTTTTTSSVPNKPKRVVARVTTTTRPRGTTTSVEPTSAFVGTSTTQGLDDSTTTTLAQ